jgi:hypothetical protein
VTEGSARKSALDDARIHGLWASELLAVSGTGAFDG